LLPSWLCKNLAIENIWVVRVEEGSGVCITGVVGCWVDVVEGIACLGIGTVLSVVERLVVLELVGGRLKEEGCGELAEGRGGEGVGADALGSASSSMAACYSGCFLSQSEGMLQPWTPKDRVQSEQ
jgi:hypothetical protein